MYQEYCPKTKMQNILFKLSYSAQNLPFWTILFPYKLCVTEKRTYINKLRFPIFSRVVISPLKTLDFILAISYQDKYLWIKSRIVITKYQKTKCKCWNSEWLHKVCTPIVKSSKVVSQKYSSNILFSIQFKIFYYTSTTHTHVGSRALFPQSFYRHMRSKDWCSALCWSNGKPAQL